jgi:hypothetical protein
VNVERLPYWFLRTLKELDIEPIYGDYRDISFAINVLALRPGVIVMDRRACGPGDPGTARGEDPAGGLGRMHETRGRGALFLPAPGARQGLA